MSKSLPSNPGEKLGPDSDVVVSCRVRFARNLAQFPFVNRATDAQLGEVLSVVRQSLLTEPVAPGMIWVDLKASSQRDRRLLFERHLISRHLAESEVRRAVAISGDESLSIMVNEEDHLRMQVIGSGMKLYELAQELDRVDSHVESRVEYAYSCRWGYLTACPTNVGTGIRFSVMLHLPALKMTEEIERVRRAAKDLHLEVRGYYGEGSESVGDFYQVSNQVTLGRTEEELRQDFEQRIVPQIIEYERQARQRMIEKNRLVLEDRIFRSLAVLRAARLLALEDAMKLLSRVRLGVHLGLVGGIGANLVHELFLRVQPGHLKAREAGETSAQDEKALRAALVRNALESGTLPSSTSR